MRSKSAAARPGDEDKAATVGAQRPLLAPPTLALVARGAALPAGQLKPGLY